MNIQELQQVLFWCMVLNLALLLFSSVMIIGFGAMVRRIHSRLYGITQEQAAVAVYRNLNSYRNLVIFFVIIPWIAVRIVAW